ncbi:hypothetical protein [Pelotalea chapellei]|uniref:Uncharacterized protein n=1 Tax=Pelotalea chapellei TaxID=44671 RepID=A0ABS5U5L3_9BACT|nr:hypothetical protein [Pelotalea chapellei]MBT1070944.1 hypothetical protein [Pelotalea chapellei]
MMLRRSTIYLGTTMGLILIMVGLFLHASGQVRASGSLFARKIVLVKQLELTDLCLFTEASYTRHLSMTDLSTPFQDSPMALEHFPTGALVEPPPHLVRNHGSH